MMIKIYRLCIFCMTESRQTKLTNKQELTEKQSHQPYCANGDFCTSATDDAFCMHSVSLDAFHSRDQVIFGKHKSEEGHSCGAVF